MKQLITIIVFFVFLGCSTKQAPVIQLTPEEIKAAELKEKEEERLWRIQYIKSCKETICEKLLEVKQCDEELAGFRKQKQQYGRIYTMGGPGPDFWMYNKGVALQEIENTKEEYYKLTGKKFNISECRNYRPKKIE